MNANTTAPGDDRAAANPESATATPATIPADGAQTVTPAPVPTQADGTQNRDSSGAEPTAAEHTTGDPIRDDGDAPTMLPPSEPDAADLPGDGGTPKNQEQGRGD